MSAGNNRALRMRNRWIRWAILFGVLVLVTGVAVGHQYINGSAKPTTIDALCPFGGIESLYSVITGAGYVDKIAASSFVLLIGTIGLALFFRRSFCGQICPLGTLQEAFGALGRKLLGRRKRPVVPAVIDKPARLLKYLVLVVFGVWTWQAAELVIRPYDPWAAWAHLTSAEVLTDFGIGLAVLGVSLVGSAVYERFFCKYLCPMGAFLAIFSKVSFLNLSRNAATCTNCSACDKACPMNIPVSTAETVTSSECISCNECVNACPVSGTLEVKAPQARAGAAGGDTQVGGLNRKAGLGTLTTTSLVALGFAALVGASTLTGTFRWTMPSLADALKAQPAAASSADGEVVPAFDTALIKGYMSMREISEATGIPAEEFMAKWGVPEEALGEPMKEIKDEFGFTPEDVRAWVDEVLAAR